MNLKIKIKENMSTIVLYKNHPMNNNNKINPNFLVTNSTTIHTQSNNTHNNSSNNKSSTSSKIINIS